MKVRKIIRKVLIILSVIFIVMQFFRSQKNNSGDVSHDIAGVYTIPDNVKNILSKSCNDCHSNRTNYPWYSNIQPFGWWLNNHVEEGKRELNFNEFASYRLYRQYHKLEEMIKEIEDDEMPLSSYTLIHRDAILNDREKSELINWVKGVRQSMESTYPADSLTRPKKHK